MSDDEDKPRDNVVTLVPKEVGEPPPNSFLASINYGHGVKEEVIFDYHFMSGTVPNMLEFYININGTNKMRLIGMVNVEKVASIDIMEMIDLDNGY